MINIPKLLCRVEDYMAAKGISYDAKLRVEIRSAIAQTQDQAQALALTVKALDSLLPYLAKVPADVGLINEALCAARKFVEGEKK